MAASAPLSGNFVERLQQLLLTHSLPPQCLEIELTENVTQTGTTTITLRGRKADRGTYPSHRLYVPSTQAPAVVRFLRRHIR